MSQDYVLPVGSTQANVALRTLIPNALQAVRSFFAGAAEPSSPIARQAWLDETTGLLKIRNAANSQWVVVASVNVEDVRQHACTTVASLSATTTVSIGPMPRASTATGLLLVCDTASTSSSGNEWQVQLRNRPNSAPASPVNLFSATVGTFTALGGVGGGAEFVAYKALLFTPNQNQALLQYDVLEVVMTKVGTATTLTNFRAYAMVR